VLVDLGGDRVDAHDRLVLVRVPVPRGVLDQVVADRDHQIGLVEPGHAVVARLQTHRSERELVVGVHQPLGHERRGDRDTGSPRERANGVRRPPADRAVPRE
jgi:hypothetical protein